MSLGEWKNKYQKKYYDENRESFSARHHKWVENNREHVNSYQKKWRKENPDKAKAQRDKSYQRRKERLQKEGFRTIC